MDAFWCWPSRPGIHRSPLRIADVIIRRERELGVHIEPDRDTEAWKLAQRIAYDRMTITNTELEDDE